MEAGHESGVDVLDPRFRPVYDACSCDVPTAKRVSTKRALIASTKTAEAKG